MGLEEIIPAIALIAILILILPEFINTNILGTKNLLDFYETTGLLPKMLSIITGESPISLRIVDWFATNYSKKNWTQYMHNHKRFKVYVDYKLKLKAYSKKRFDPFCRWERIQIPYHNNTFIETTIGQLNFFKWALENGVIDFIEENYETIEKDMNTRNSTSRKKVTPIENTKTRKKREELSISASKSIKKEQVDICVSFK